MSVGGLPAMMRRCPICESPTRPWRTTDNVAIVRCRRCGHRQAAFSGGDVQADYHAQYVEGARLDALQATRGRQARIILGAVHRHIPDADDLLDFGSGRGWFLRTCREHGLRRGAAADTSPLAVQTASDDGFAAILVPAGDSPQDIAPLLRTLPFRPRVITLLDVVEHFPPPAMEPALRSIVDALHPELELVVVKVPAAEGLLHRGASLAARLHIPGPLEQLYQVGTFPPHYNYFTRGSLRLMARNLGWDVLEVVGDRDFEPANLPDRVLAMHRLPGLVRHVVGRAVGGATSLLPMPDAQILFARPGVVQQGRA